MSAKEEIQRLAAVLSDFECDQLARAMRRTAAGERFWEEDVAVFYNEYVKTRYSTFGDNPAQLIPAMPGAEEGLFFPIPMVKSYGDAERVELAPPTRLAAGVTDTMLNRRSRRDYTGATISADQLATLLGHACGMTGAVAGYGYSALPLRSFPSAGGLQAPEVYLSVQAVTGVSAGLYHYHSIDHALETLERGDLGSVLTSIALGQDLESAAVVFLISGCYERLRWKYAERAYRYMCMDTGFLGQNLCLAAEALGLGACAIAGFVDDAVDDLLGIDGRDEMAMLLVSVGVPRDRQTDGAAG